MRQNPHVRICGGPGSATTLVYLTWDTAERLFGGAPMTFESQRGRMNTRNPIDEAYAAVRRHVQRLPRQHRALVG